MATKLTNIIDAIVTRVMGSEQFTRAHKSPRRDYGEDLPCFVVWPDSIGQGDGADGQPLRQCTLRFSVVQRANSDAGEDLTELIEAVEAGVHGDTPLPHNANVHPSQPDDWQYATDVYDKQEGALLWADATALIEYETALGEM